MSRCTSCKGALPGGCSECRPMHIRPVSDQEWKANQPSLSAAVGAVIEKSKAEPDRRSAECQ